MTDFRHPEPILPLSFLLFEQEQVEPAALASVLMAELPDVTVMLDPQDTIVQVQFDEGVAYVSVVDAPIPAAEVDNAVANNVAWEDGKQIVSKQRSHVIVTAMGLPQDDDGDDGAGKGGSGSCGCGGCTCGADGGPDARWDALVRSLHVTEVVGALAGMDGCLGIYVGSQSVVYSPEFFRTVLSEAIAEETLPVPLLTYLLCGPREEGGSAAFTNGLAALGHMDLEFTSDDDDLEALYQLMFNVVHYILGSGAELSPGETLGYSEDEHLEITLGAGTFVAGDVLHVKA